MLADEQTADPRYVQFAQDCESRVHEAVDMAVDRYRSRMLKLWAAAYEEERKCADKDYEHPFAWLDQTNDYKDEQLYGPKLKDMPRQHLFLLEVFYQTHPKFIQKTDAKYISKEA